MVVINYQEKVQGHYAKSPVCNVHIIYMKGEKIIRCSFDFDGTLSEERVQIYARELIARGVEVWIVTSRFENAGKYNEFFNESLQISYDHRDLEEVAEDLRIPENRIIFTNMEDKSVYLRDGDFKWHLDDDWSILRDIQSFAKTPAISVMKSGWKEKCDRLLNKIK